MRLIFEEILEKSDVGSSKQYNFFHVCQLLHWIHTKLQVIMIVLFPDYWERHRGCSSYLRVSVLSWPYVHCKIRQTLLPLHLWCSQQGNQAFSPPDSYHCLGCHLLGKGGGASATQLDYIEFNIINYRSPLLYKSNNFLNINTNDDILYQMNKTLSWTIHIIMGL